MSVSILSADIEALIAERKSRLDQLTLAQAEQDARRIQKQLGGKRSKAKDWYAARILGEGNSWYHVQERCARNLDQGGARPPAKPIPVIHIQGLFPLYTADLPDASRISADWVDENGAAIAAGTEAPRNGVFRLKEPLAVRDRQKVEVTLRFEMRRYPHAETAWIAFSESRSLLGRTATTWQLQAAVHAAEAVFLLKLDHPALWLKAILENDLLQTPQAGAQAWLSMSELRLGLPDWVAEQERKGGLRFVIDKASLNTRLVFLQRHLLGASLPVSECDIDALGTSNETLKLSAKLAVVYPPLTKLRLLEMDARALEVRVEKEARLAITLASLCKQVSIWRCGSDQTLPEFPAGSGSLRAAWEAYWHQPGLKPAYVVGASCGDRIAFEVLWDADLAASEFDVYRRSCAWEKVFVGTTLLNHWTEAEAKVRAGGGIEVFLTARIPDATPWEMDAADMGEGDPEAGTGMVKAAYALLATGDRADPVHQSLPMDAEISGEAEIGMYELHVPARQAYRFV